MAIEKNFYPPVIDTYMPAFPIVKDDEGNESAVIKIYFALSSYNSFDQVSDYVQVIVRNQYTNQSLLNSTNGIKVIDKLQIDSSVSGSNKYYIELTEQDFTTQNFEINQYMKAQIRFTKKGEATKTKIEDIDINWFNTYLDQFSEWSTVCLLRPISQPNLYISELAQDFTIGTLSSVFYLSNLTDLNGTLTFADDKEQEKLETYRIRAYIDDDEENLITDSGLLYADEYTPNIFKYTFNYQFNEDVNYRINFEYTTITKYSDSKDFYIKIITSGGNPLNAKLYTESQDDLGRIKIQVKHTDENVSGFIGIINFRRTSSESNYTVWEDIHKVYISEGKPLDYTWYDYTTKSGVFYRYGVQKIDNLGRRGILLRELDEEDNPISAINYLDDIFIVRDGKILCLKYNPSIDSVTRNVMESVTTTLGSKFPFITKNGVTNYKSFSIDTLISFFSDEYNLITTDENGHNNFTNENLFTSKDEIYLNSDIVNEYNKFNTAHHITEQNDYIYERDFREKVLDFLHEDNIKLFRSTPEGNLLVKFTDISISPEQELGRLVYTLSATVTEVSDYSVDNNDKYGVQYIGDIEQNSATENFIGQVSGIFKNTDSVIAAIEDKHKYESSSDTINKFKNFTWLKIRFSDSTEAQTIYSYQNNLSTIIQSNKATKVGLGYIVNINNKDIFISKEKPYYEINNLNTPITSLYFPTIDQLYDGGPTVTIDYIVTMEKVVAEQKIVNNIFAYKGVGQIRKTFKYNEHILSILQNKYQVSSSSYYVKLLSIDRLEIEAEAGTVLYIKDSMDNNNYYKHILWNTNNIDFYDTQCVILDAYFGGLYLSIEKLHQDEKTYNFLSEISQPVEYGLYKISTKHLMGSDDTLSDIENKISKKNLALLREEGLENMEDYKNIIVTTDEDYDTYVFLDNKFYKFDTETQIIQKPTKAYVNYTYEIEKGEYYHD
jgi:hypothetical protein